MFVSRMRAASAATLMPPADSSTNRAMEPGAKVFICRWMDSK